MAQTLSGYIAEKALQRREDAKQEDSSSSRSTQKRDNSTLTSFLLNRPDSKNRGKSSGANTLTESILIKIQERRSQDEKKAKQEQLSFKKELGMHLENLVSRTSRIKTKVYELGRVLSDVTEQEMAMSQNITVLSQLLTQRASLEKTVFAAIAHKFTDFPDIGVKEAKTPPIPQTTQEPQNQSVSAPSAPQKSTPTINPPSSPDKKAEGTIKPGLSKKDKTQSLVPYADVMQLPLQAAGIASINLIGEFISKSGALGGFFKPYVRSIIKPFALALGVGESLLNTLLVSPVNAAERDKAIAMRDFGKTWGKFLDDDKFVKRFIDREEYDGEVSPGPPGSGTDFWTLAAVAALEDGRAQGVADVAQSVYNRLADGMYGKSVYDILTRDGQYQVAFIDPTASRGPGTKVADIWKSIKDSDSAAAAIMYYYEKRGQSITREQAKRKAEAAAEAIRNPTLQKKAAEFVQGRTDFLANDPEGVKRPEGGNSFTWKYGRRLVGSSAAPIPSFSRGGFDTRIMTPMTPFVVSGPESGFDFTVHDDLGRPYSMTLHGTELLDPQEAGVKIYPIQNRSFDITKDPLALAKRWRDIAYNTGEKSTASYSSGGSAEFWKVAALASKEDSLHPQGQADIAQSLYNRAAIGSYPGGRSISAIITAPGQYQPTFGNAGKWNAIRDRKSAIAAVGNASKVDMAAKSITNPVLQKAAAIFVGGRTDFMGESQKPYMKPGDITRGKNYNFHGWFYDAKLPKPAPVPKTISSQTRVAATSNKSTPKIVVNKIGGGSSSPTVVSRPQKSQTTVSTSFDPLKFIRELTMRRSR